MLEFLEYVLRRLVEYPDEVLITPVEKGENQLLFRVQLRPSDVGKVIGRSGNTIKAIRSLLHAAAARQEKKVDVEIVEPPPSEA